MSSSVSRRAVAKGAAWSVPVLAVGAVAPMAAASTCPTVTLVSGTAGKGTVAIQIQFVSDGDTYCVTSFSATGGRPGSVSLIYNNATVSAGSHCGTSSASFLALASDNGNNVTGGYTGSVTFRTATGFQCSVPVQFTVS
jgi:hypothetical protein